MVIMVPTDTTPTTSTTERFNNNNNNNNKHHRRKMRFWCVVLVGCIVVGLIGNVTLLTRRKPLWVVTDGGGSLLSDVGVVPMPSSTSPWWNNGADETEDINTQRQREDQTDHDDKNKDDVHESNRPDRTASGTMKTTSSTSNSSSSSSSSRTIRATHTFNSPPPTVTKSTKASLSSKSSSIRTTKSTTAHTTTTATTDTTTTTNTTPPIPELSFCLLIKDDNDILNEWIAYHYHVMNLRRIIVAIDPTSETSPQGLLEVWGTIFQLKYTIWTDKHYMPSKFVRGNYSDVPKLVRKEIKPHPDDPNGDNGTMITTIWHSRDTSKNHTQEEIQHDIQMTDNHRYRQAVFVSRCYKQLQKEGRTWTAHIDTDEYVVVNPHIRHRLQHSNSLTMSNGTRTNKASRGFKKKVEGRIGNSNYNKTEHDVDKDVVDILLDDTGSKRLKYYIYKERHRRQQQNDGLKTKTTTTTKTIPSYSDLSMVVPTVATENSLVLYWQRMAQMYPPFKDDDTVSKKKVDKVSPQHLSSPTCIMMPTLLFGPREDSTMARKNDDNIDDAVDPTKSPSVRWNVTNFETIRWRYHGGLPRRTNGFPKTIVNVQPIPANHWIYRVGRVSNIHQPLPSFGSPNGMDSAYCPGNVALWYPKGDKPTPYKMPFQQAALYRPLAIQHYMGSLDRYLVRADIRRNRLIYEERAGHVKDTRMSDDEVTWMGSWPDEFVKRHGIHKAMKVLKDYAAVDDDVTATVEAR